MTDEEAELSKLLEAMVEEPGYQGWRLRLCTQPHSHDLATTDRCDRCGVPTCTKHLQARWALRGREIHQLCPDCVETRDAVEAPCRVRVRVST